jgi:hypothetical protein
VHQVLAVFQELLGDGERVLVFAVGDQPQRGDDRHPRSQRTFDFARR